MKIKNKSLIKLIKSFKEDLVETIKKNDLAGGNEVDDLFEEMLCSYLDAVPLGITDFIEMIQNPKMIEKNYEDMHDPEPDV